MSHPMACCIWWPSRRCWVARNHRLAEHLDVRLLETARDLVRAAPDIPAKGLLTLGGIDYGPLHICNKVQHSQLFDRRHCQSSLKESASH